MAAAESASASLGPRYAPEDPTLPKPWTGLIDGSTGLQYYWNPETNVTQYERPAAAAAAGAPPPLPSGRPPTATTPKMASIPAPRVLQQNGTGLQTGQQVLQQTSQLMQQSQSHNQQTYPQPVQQFSQPQQQLPLSGQQLPHNQLVHQPSHMQPGQQAQHQQPGQQIHPQQPVQQMHYQQMPYSQMQQIPYSQTQQVPHSQVQQPPPHQMLNQTGQHAGFHREEAAPQQGKQVGYSSSYAQPSGAIPSTANSSAPNSQFQVPQAGAHSLQVQQQIGGSSSVSGPQSAAPLLQIQQSVDAIQQQQQFNGMTKSPNQMGQAMGNNSMPIRPPVRLNEHGESLHGRARDEFYGNSPREMPSMGLQQPKLAQLPIASNLQETRTSAIHPQNFAPGHAAGFNMAPVRPMSNMYNHAVASRPFPNAVPMRSSPHMLGAADHLDVSATEVYRRQHEVTAMGENVPAPFMTFETTGFPPEILREMHFAGFLSPTPIQAQTWPVALQGRDIVAIAKTGSGKTLGYIIPAFLHLRRQRNNPQIGPTVLVLAPTRELATQIQDEAIKFGRSSGISCTCLYGGAPKGPQLREIERGADIIIATPGRLNDILEMNKINFCQVSFLVLDEADRMLDMGFEPQIRKVVNEIPPHRQTLMYTATWPKEVRKIAGDLLCNPVQVNIGNVDELAANKAITQYVEVVPPMDKQRRLEQILRSQERGSKIIIFCSTKKLCDQLTHSVGRSFGAIAIHGDKSQGERDWALNQFRSGKLPILVATDVAARGLDVKDIRVVINYDFPTGVEDYVHRIGRTGRAGATGIAYTFFSDQDWKYAADLIKILEGANQRVPPEVREMATRGAPVFSKGRGGNGHLDSGGGRWDSGGGRGGRGGGGGFGGHGGRTDHFGGRGGRTDHFGGRDFGGLGRDFGGRASRGGRGFGGPGGWGRGGPGQHDRHGYVDGRGRGRFDNRRAFGERSRDRSYSRSPDRGRARGYDRSRSSSRSRRRSRSRSRSYSRSRSRSRSSRSTSYDRFDRPQGQNTTRAPRVSGFDVLPPAGLDALPQAGFGAPPTAGFNAPPPSGFDAHPPSGSLAVPAREMSPMSPGAEHTGTLRSDLAHKAPDADDGGGLNDGGGLTFPAAITEP